MASLYKVARSLIEANRSPGMKVRAACIHAARLHGPP